MHYAEILQRTGYLFLRDKRYKYLDELTKNIYITKEELVKKQNCQIQRLIQHAYNKTVYYRNLFDGLGISPEDINNKKDLLSLPELTKKDILNNFKLIISSDHYGKNAFKVSSGGSTGNMVTILKSNYYHQIERAAWLRNNRMIGWEPTDKSLWLWGAPFENQKIKSNILSRIGIKINRRLIINAYRYNIKYFPNWIDRIKEFKPKVIYGYSSIIYKFAKYLLENYEKLQSIKIVVSTTEELKEREIISEAFQCKVIDQYGCREAIAIGIENHHGNLSISDDVYAVHLNEKQHVLITSLYSFGFPLINYVNGDIFYKNSENDNLTSSEIPFSEMKLKIGRITDNFINKKGESISSSALITFLSSYELDISQIQIIQKNYNLFIVNIIIKNDELFDNYKKLIKNCLEKYFGSDLSIDFHNLDSIPPESSGKTLMFKRTFNI